MELLLTALAVAVALAVKAVVVLMGALTMLMVALDYNLMF